MYKMIELDEGRLGQDTQPHIDSVDDLSLVMLDPSWTGGQVHPTIH